MKVYTPNETFDGRRYGVEFKNGVGEATEKQAKILVANWGYRCPDLESPSAANKAAADKAAADKAAADKAAADKAAADKSGGTKKNL